MKKFNIHIYLFFVIFFILAQILIPTYFYVISQVELLLLFIFIFLLLNAYNYFKNLIINSLNSYNSSLKILIKNEVYLIFIYLNNLQLFFKIILNLYCLMFGFFKKFLIIYTKQILSLYNLLATLINYLYLNFLITIFLEAINIKVLLINKVKNYNLHFLFVNNKLLAFNKNLTISS